MTPTDWDQIATPALVVDVQRLDRNIATTAATFSDAGVALRPHIKTSKCLQVAERQRAAGAIGFTCSTPAEVRALTDAGFTGLVWAHLPVGPAKVAVAVELVRRGDVTLLVDSVEVARPLAAALQAAGIVAPVLIDVDTGLDRTGAAPGEVVALADSIADLQGLRLVGVLTHEGHVGGLRGDRRAMEAAATEVGVTLSRVADRLLAAGHACEIVSVGSTPGMRSAPFQTGVTEGRPGTYVMFDANQVRNESAQWDQCALSVVSRVVSVRSDGAVIIDAGSKAMSSDTVTDEAGFGTVVEMGGNLLTGWSFPVAHEEHGFLRRVGFEVTGGGEVRDLQVGDLVRIIPNHACGTVNMWSSLLAVLPDSTTEVWPTMGRH